MDQVTGTLYYGRAARTLADVGIQSGTESGVDLAVEIVRDLLPDLLAAHCYHGLFPFSKGTRLNHDSLIRGASKSRNISRARNNRVLTEAREIPKASATSSMLKCCMSRNTNTSRYLAPNDAKASSKIVRTSLRSSASEGISRQSAK